MACQNDRQGKKVTGQQAFLAGHCMLIGRYFEPWFTIRIDYYFTIRFTVLDMFGCLI